jgi:outer membrane protein assembly factor BamB
MRCQIRILSFLLAYWLILSRGITAEPAARWAHWRGPTGQGYSDDTRIPLSWSETENILWKTALPGVGNSSPIVWGDRIFLTAASGNGDERHVLCVRASDGKLLWQQVASKGVPDGRSHAWNGYASPSCATDGKHVYAFFGTPGLFCYDFDGKLIWKHNFGVFTTETGWGIAASPVVVDDLVIQNCDNDGAKALPPGRKPEEAAPAALVALDKNTGKVRWAAPRNQGRGYSTPILVATAAGRRDLWLNSPLGLWGYDPQTGKELWHCRRGNGGQSLFGEPLPVWNDQMLFLSSGRPGVCLGVKLPGDGDITQSHVVWEGTRKGHRDVSSPILWEGLVYAADSRGMLSCLDLKTGEERYNERIGNGTNKSLASPVAVGGKLLFVLDDGVTVVVDPGPKLVVAGRNRLGEGKPLDFAASPAIAEGRLYLRSQSTLYCIGQR